MYTGQCPVLQGRATPNSPASGIRSAIIHRTVRCASGATATSRQRSPADALNARQKRVEVRHARSGAPDTLQCMSGVPPDIQAGPVVRAPTVGTQRPGDVAGALDTVRCAPDSPVHHATDSLHQTTSLVVGAINTPNHPTFKTSKFSHFNYLQEL